MTDDLSHLSDQAKLALELPLEERILYVQKRRWIGYPKAKDILDRLEALMVHPKTSRMPNLLIVARTNNGKTHLMNQFLKAHPADDNPEGEAIKVPVLYVEAPPVPEEVRFYEAILDSLFVAHKSTHRANDKFRQVVAVLERIQPKILAVDELHNILAGPPTKQRQFLNVLKSLGNLLQIPIVGLGTEDAIRVIQSDPQLANRFEPVVLPRWELNAEYLRLLSSFERIVPLRKQSGLNQRDIALRILALSEGTIGEISSLLNRAAVWAIRSGSEAIDEKALAGCGYTSPSKRKSAISQV